ncbi:MAG TPA: PHB depolymerase family esterase [Casimicrobiaceae bacterium]|nr:PHB depolymerase family esterase [Casimicrobiaceae bacterium]
MAGPASQNASLWTRLRGLFARLFRRGPPPPGRFERGSKYSWRGWIGTAPWTWPARDYLVYVPRGHAGWRRRPLVVLLHGCRQTPEEIAAGTRITRLADERGWLVLLPRQTTQANAWGCWNWFDRRTVAGKGEAAIVAAQVRAARRLYRGHPRRIFLLGMSAGACLGAVLALRSAKLFAAVGLHSGVPCGAAIGAAAALQAMANGPRGDVDAVARAARAETPPRALPLPVCILHGERDNVVAEANSIALLRQFLVFNGRPPEAEALPEADARSVTQDRSGRTVTTEDYRLGAQLVARRIRVDALGHAWSGGDGAFAYNDSEGPEATALFGGFFAAQLGGRRGGSGTAQDKPFGGE